MLHEIFHVVFLVGHQGDKVLVHGCAEAMLVLLRRDDRWVLIGDGLLQVGLELFLERVLLNVVDYAKANRFSHWVDYHEHRVVDDGVLGEVHAVIGDGDLHYFLHRVHHRDGSRLAII